MTQTFCSFQLSLKVKGRIGKLSINSEDNKQSVLVKFQKIYPNCINHQVQSLEKIRRQLEGLCQSQKVREQLRQSVKLCLSKIYDQEYSLETQSQLTQVSQPSRVQSCFSEFIVVPPRMTSSKDAKSKSTQTEHLSDPRQTRQKNKGPIFNAFEPKSVQLAKPLKRSKVIKDDEEAENVPPEAKSGILEKKRNPQRKSRCNADVIKACENIMKKHNANEMKVMAKQFLKEKGCLKEEQEMTRPRKHNIVTEPSHPLPSAFDQKYSQSLLKSRCRHAPTNPEDHSDHSASLTQQIAPKSQSVTKRFQYLDDSVSPLRGKYFEKNPIQKEEPLIAQRKYRYLDD